jgi:hypothetical protein
MSARDYGGISEIVIAERSDESQQEPRQRTSSTPSPSNSNRVLTTLKGHHKH